MATYRNNRRFTVLLALVSLIVMTLGTGAASARHGHDDPDKDRGKPVDDSGVDFWLSVIHNNDGESQLIDAGDGFLEDFGGVARFDTVAARLVSESTNARYRHGIDGGAITVSSGDNFLAGPEFNASLDKGVPFYDTIAMERIFYDAVAIGNHDFDFGPDVLVDFIEGFGAKRAPVFLSANLDFSAEPELQALVDDGRIASSTVVWEWGEQIGIIGATTTQLANISSPRDVIVTEVAPAVQAEVDALTDDGVDKIVLISHLQSIDEDLELAGMLSGIDVMVAGGGDELLANEDDLLVPADADGTRPEPFGPYPMIAESADGAEVPVVTTQGSYTYAGNLVVGFDEDGNVVEIDEERSRPVRVVGDDCGGTLPCDDTVKPDAKLLKTVVEPLIDDLAELDATILAQSDVDLDGRRTSVRSMETNQGNLIADSLLWQAGQLADEFGVAEPVVALQNGGGIRNDSVIPAGPISELTTFDMVPFANFVSVVEDVPRETFKTILENAYSAVEAGDGRFAQVAGFSVTYDPAGTPMVTDPLTGEVTQEGDRIVSVVLDDGTVIVEGGTVVDGDPIDVATIDFLARGGDQYPFGDLPFTTLGVTYQQALANYLTEALGGQITAADYPAGGEGRITP